VANSGAQAQAAREAARMGTTQMFQGTDGNWYAVTPTYTKNGGVEFTTKQVNPPGVGLIKPGGAAGAGAGAAGKPTKVEEEGLFFNVPGAGPLKADGRGGFMAIDGITLGARAEHLLKQGVPKDLTERVLWHANGVQVTLDGKKQWDVRDKGEMRGMVQDYYRQREAQLRTEEAQRAEAERAKRLANPPSYKPGEEPAIFYPQFKKLTPKNKPPVGLSR
jgi:hypothetical protein